MHLNQTTGNNRPKEGRPSVDQPPSIAWAPLVAFAVLAAATVGFDHFFYGAPPWGKRALDFSAIGLVRAGVLATAALALARSFAGAEAPRRRPGPVFAAHYGASAMVLATAAVLIVAAPDALTALGSEDRFLETLSAALLIGAGLAMAGSAANRPATAPMYRLAPPWLFPVLAGCLLIVIGLEEISWGQRALDLSTPTQFAGNRQNEINFHNFHTRLFEFAYYGVAWLAFIFIPLTASAGVRSAAARANVYIPGPAFAICAAPLAFLQAQMWNNVSTQIAMWTTAILLYGLATGEPGLRRVMARAMLALCVAGQIVFLMRADSLLRPWDLTEYRETVIALACAAYAARAVLGWRRLAAEAGGP